LGRRAVAREASERELGALRAQVSELQMALKVAADDAARLAKQRSSDAAEAETQVRWLGCWQRCCYSTFCSPWLLHVLVTHRRTVTMCGCVDECRFDGFVFNRLGAQPYTQLRDGLIRV
jgi:hypothetical protein